MGMRYVCATCNICKDDVPYQEMDREWSIGLDESKILVIDDNSSGLFMSSIGIANKLLPKNSFTYTTTVRCVCKDESTIPQSVVTRCAVWTNLLLGNRMVILTTKRGLEQMKIGNEKKEGDLFRSSIYGLILCIPPLLSIPKEEIPTYQTKAKRILREIGL